MNKIKTAWELAYKYHEGQKYGKLPYTYHINLVVSNVITYHHYSESLIVVAILHDILEDTDIDRHVLKGFLEAHEYDALIALTKGPSETYNYYLERVSKNRVATIVKLEDIRANKQQNLDEGNLARANYYQGKEDYLRFQSK